LETIGVLGFDAFKGTLLRVIRLNFACTGHVSKRANLKHQSWILHTTPRPDYPARRRIS
jgi:hypothetical protein